MSILKVTINLVVLNGEKYLRQCLDSILTQTYDHNQIEVNIWDNASIDDTKRIIEEYKSKFQESDFSLLTVHYSPSNLGMWPVQEMLFDKHSQGDYIIVISVDIIIDLNFVRNSMEIMDRDFKIGAIQAKILQYRLQENGDPKILNVLDTAGFQIFKSRRLINIGHGQIDQGQYEKEMEIFAVEGAVPVFRREALEDLRIDGHFIDPDFFWYGDDIDLTWRMRLFDWKQIYSPRVIAYHDRGTTKGLAESRGSFVAMRRELPMYKRRLDWRNWTLAVIKNDYVSNFLKDLPSIIWRQVQLWVYFIIFEPVMILEIPKVVRLLPNVLKRRREIMRKAHVSASEIHRWFH